MGLTDYTTLTDDINGPADMAAAYVSGIRLKQAVSARVFGRIYDPEVKPIDIMACVRYLDMKGKRDWDCTCPAKERAGAKHSNLCLISPEYATVSRQLDCAPELVSSAISFAFWYLNWDDWDVTKHQIRNLVKGQEFPWESEQKTP